MSKWILIIITLAMPIYLSGCFGGNQPEPEDQCAPE